MNHGTILALGMIVALAGDPPPVSPTGKDRGYAPAPHRPLGPGVLHGDVSALNPGTETRNSARQRIQDPLDRSNGYITPEPLYQLDRLDQLRRDRRPPYDPRSGSREFFQYFERWLRLDARQITQQREAATHAAELGGRDGLNRASDGDALSGSSEISSLIGLQAEQDRLALERARLRRDAAMKTAGADPAKRREIEQAYHAERVRIFEVDLPEPDAQPPEPTSQPAAVAGESAISPPP